MGHFFLDTQYKNLFSRLIMDQLGQNEVNNIHKQVGNTSDWVRTATGAWLETRIIIKWEATIPIQISSINDFTSDAPL